MLIAVFCVGAYASDYPESFVQVEELFLVPNHPKENLWSSPAAALKTSYYGCPLHTVWECEIWAQKPTVIETLAVPARRIKQDANFEAALLKRYHALMNYARTCCVAGMESKLKSAGASNGLVYKFMVDDANFYGFGDRCLMTTDAQLQDKYPGTEIAKAVSDVRDSCVCLRADYLGALLAPFDKAPDTEFVYTYTDGLDRDVTVSVSDDVNVIREMLSECK